MSDLIYREAALDEVRSYYDSEYVAPNHKSIEERIEDLPSAQPEIIYCKDCRFARMTDNGEVKYCDVWSPDDKVYMDAETNFCSCGERKEEKNNG